MLHALCLDLMGTLVTDPYREALRAGTGLDPAALAGLRDPDAWPAFEAGTIDEATFARRFFADPDAGHRLDLDAFHRVRRAGYAFVPGMEALLDDTAGLLERYVASNYPVWIDDIATALALPARTEGVYASCRLGVRKPAPRFYEHLLDGIGHAPHHCLFVDDRADNCEGAEAAGMRAHLFTSAADLRARLRAEGVPIAAEAGGGPAGGPK